jgi:tRNA (uracil-5-)-methyltransferase
LRSRANDGRFRNIGTYKRGATLLLRDSFPAEPGPSEAPNPHTCLTDQKALARERVGPVSFEFPAGSFFQNNNSILPSLVSYVQSAIPSTATHLVDTYCGVGFFAISLASQFAVVAGVEISADAITYARRNATLNGCEGIAFTTGKAESIFDTVSDFPPNETVVIIDPPRKGCDTAFLQQLVKLKPATLVYVSCNVHTQARDVGSLLKLMESEEGTYNVQSIRGFDLFPQTSHVESVAVLKLGPKE